MNRPTAIRGSSSSCSVVAVVTFIPLLVLVFNWQFNAPPPARRIRVVTSNALRAKSISVIPPPPPTSSPPPPPPPPSPSASTINSCGNGTAHVELWGSLVLAGTDNEQPTAADCCRSCAEYEPTLDVLNGAQCNAWVWHLTEPHACWLKYQKPEELPHALKRVREGPPPNSKVPWASGVNQQIKPCADCIAPTNYNGCIGKDRCNTSRACGSPAIDGYSHVEPKCIAKSPTALLYKKLFEEGTKLVAYHDLAADYDGLGVKWGIGHYKATWQECEEACRSFNPKTGGGPFVGLPCNVWTWCSRKKCFEPDAHSHSFGDCWLKFTELPESPEVNQRTPSSSETSGEMKPSFMRRHKNQMVGGCSWVSGALLAPGAKMTNGTWGPRAYW